MSEDIVKLECQYLHKLAKYVKSKCKRRIIDYLSQLKDDPKCSKILLNGHVLNQLVSLLEYQDTTIMNLALSILANACLSVDVRNKMRDTKVVKQTLWILNNLESEEILNCRVCRLIGNLCESSYHAKAFHKAGVVKALATLLSETKSTSTNLMIVRATRNLWWYAEDSREEITEKNLIQSIAKLFETTINDSNPARNRPDLGEACLKAICTFLTRVSSEETQLNLKMKVAHQLRGSKETSGYMTLVKYCKLKNKLATKILFSLCQLPECRPDLGNCGAVQTTVDLVSNEETFSRYTLYILCLFSREAVNRFHIRTHSGLELILNFLKNPRHESYHLHLLETLTNFIFDEESIVIMLKNGLLDILTDRLKKLKVTKQEEEDKEDEDDEDEEKTVTKKRKADSFVQMESKPKIKVNRYSFDHCNEDWSPMSSSGGYYSAPNSPPGTAEEDEEGSEENYSPVCSDNEQEEEVESLKSVRSLTYYLDEGENEEKIPENVLDNFNNALTLTLLDTICHLKDPVKNLADPNIIEPLVTYIKGSKNQKAFQILSKIVGKNLYLTALIKQGFVFEAQTMYGSEQCVRQLCNLAATGGAIGELTTILSQGQESHRHITAISIPFLITSKYHLRNLLNDHGGLPLIFEVLNDNEHQLYEQAIWSICRLADSLKIQPETLEKSLIPDIVSGIDDELSSKPETVTFVLDDGSTVDACRRTLCRKSDVFTAMFNGKFLESGKRKIDLKNTSQEGLKTLLRALEGKSTLEGNEIEPLLDAVVLADKFLMSGICDTLTESSMSKLSYENYSRAWNWTRRNSCYMLKSYCVTKMFLTTRMTRSERARAFRDFSSCADFPDFLDEVWEIISSELGQR